MTLSTDLLDTLYNNEYSGTNRQT